jgi:hypothetical protein
MNSSTSRCDPNVAPVDQPRLVEVIEHEGGLTISTYEFPKRPPDDQIEHDREKRVFRATEREGKTAVFRDEPVRFLVAEPDPVTGELAPVANRRGEPKYIYLCREERGRG